MNPAGIHNGKPYFNEKYDTIRVAQYLRNRKILFNHSPNEYAVRDKQGENWIKTRGLLGTQSGWPDFEIFFPIEEKPIFIELKRADLTEKALSVNQKEIIAKLRELGYTVYVCFGFDHAIKIIDSYLALKTT
jgi:copper chaperone CopZ